MQQALYESHRPYVYVDGIWCSEYQSSSVVARFSVGRTNVDLCKFRMEKYSIQSRFYKLTEKKCALIFCIVTAAVCVALMTCLLALSVSGKLGPSKSPEAAGSGSSLQVSQC
jgi:hypothetical protein